MLNWLITAALRQRVLVIALALVLVFFGIRAGRDVPLDVFPEFAPPMVEVQTEAPGLSTEEVEALVTTPLEFAVNGTPGLGTLRSKSVLGLSSVQLRAPTSSAPASSCRNVSRSPPRAFPRTSAPR
jgi:Cu/Ag efflux pump CusA